MQFDLQHSLPGCWGDQGSCELALRIPVIAELATLSTKPFRLNFKLILSSNMRNSS